MGHGRSFACPRLPLHQKLDAPSPLFSYEEGRVVEIKVLVDSGEAPSFNVRIWYFSEMQIFPGRWRAETRGSSKADR